MNVSELIEKLEGCPRDARVVAPGYEDGVDDVIDLEAVSIKPDAFSTEWFYGRHDCVSADESGSEMAVRLKTNRRIDGE